jgi:ubiquinone/menaquinone biosynthesis C-methylase UbiE
MSANVSTVKPFKGCGMEGAVAKWYAALTKKSMDRFRELAQRTSAQLPPNSRVLEVAPGPGYYAIELARLGNYNITGLDISQTFVDIARDNASKAGVQVDFRHGNASAMPFEDDSFDFVVCAAAFKNFTQPKEALDEMYRVLCPGGKAMIIDLRRDASQESINQAVDAMRVGPANAFITKLTFRFMLLKRAYTRTGFEQLVAQTKFQSVQIREDLIALEISLTKPSTPILDPFIALMIA